MDVMLRLWPQVFQGRRKYSSFPLLSQRADEYEDTASNQDEGNKEEGGVARFWIGQRREEENQARQAGGDDNGAEDFDYHGWRMFVGVLRTKDR